MNDSHNNANDTRRTFDGLALSRRSLVGAAAAFQIIRPELVRGQAPQKLRAGLVGVGGRGRQAVQDLLTGDPNVEVVALADAFEDQLEKNLKWLKEDSRNAQIAARVKVDPDKRFVGFDAYKKLIASDVDIVMLATPPGWRPIHFEAAVEAKKNIFCEKPFGTDPVGVQRFMRAAKKSEELKLTVVSGAQRRFNKSYQETIKKIKDGVIGDVLATYAYWVGTPVIQQPAGRKENWGDAEWQHRNWYSNLWLGGDQVVEQHLHNIDVICWMMGTHPLSATAYGGVSWRPQDDVHGNIYDHLATDFVFENGVRLSSYCRQYPRGLYQNVSELAIGTKGRSNCKDLGAQPDIRDYVAEHVALVNSIRGTGPHINHAMAVAESTMTCIMAREAAYSGQELTWDQMMNSKLDLRPAEVSGYDSP
ncbi:MAG: Gfo/Idh/MocA family oxidoreductase, partial [Acidobacteriota bacterium]